MTQQTADLPRRKRGSETAVDMVRSLGLVLAVSLVVLLIGPGRALIFPSHRDRALPPDYRAALSQAAGVAGRPVPGPSPLPAGWTPNAARIDGTDPGALRMHLGFVTPAEEFVALDEAQRPAADWVASVLGAPARDTGPADVAGWRRWTTHSGTSALVRVTDGVVVVVSGTSPADVRRLAASVR